MAIILKVPAKEKFLYFFIYGIVHFTLNIFHLQAQLPRVNSFLPTLVLD